MRTSSVGRGRIGGVVALAIAIVATLVRGFAVETAEAAVAVHTPVATANFHSDISVDASLQCDSACTATLYYRTSDAWILPPHDLYTSTEMTLSPAATPGVN